MTSRYACNIKKQAFDFGLKRCVVHFIYQFGFLEKIAPPFKFNRVANHEIQNMWKSDMLPMKNFFLDFYIKCKK